MDINEEFYRLYRRTLEDVAAAIQRGALALEARTPRFEVGTLAAIAAENRRVRAYAQRERGDDGEAGILPQRPQAVSRILSEHLDKSDSTHIAMILL